MVVTDIKLKPYKVYRQLEPYQKVKGGDWVAALLEVGEVWAANGRDAMKLAQEQGFAVSPIVSRVG